MTTPGRRDDLPGDPAASSENVFITVEEAAALLRVNPKTLYAAVKLNQVPGVMRVGRVIRINREALLTGSSVTHAADVTASPDHRISGATRHRPVPDLRRRS